MSILNKIIKDGDLDKTGTFKPVNPVKEAVNSLLDKIPRSASELIALARRQLNEDEMTLFGKKLDRAINELQTPETTHLTIDKIPGMQAVIDDFKKQLNEFESQVNSNPIDPVKDLREKLKELRDLPAIEKSEIKELDDIKNAPRP